MRKMPIMPHDLLSIRSKLRFSKREGCHFVSSQLSSVFLSLAQIFDPSKQLMSDCFVLGDRSIAVLIKWNEIIQKRRRKCLTLNYSAFTPTPFTPLSLFLRRLAAAVAAIPLTKLSPVPLQSSTKGSKPWLAPTKTSPSQFQKERRHA